LSVHHRTQEKIQVALTSDPKENQLLAALPDEEFLRWLPKLEAVEMPLGGARQRF
jgi:hypothetical protein